MSVPERRVFFLDDTLIDGHLKTIKLQHPGSEKKPAQFIITESSPHRIFELLAFGEKLRSFFIGQNVSSDGNIYLTLPFDPLYIILNYLNSSQNIQPLDHLLEDPEYPDNRQLLKVIDPKQIDLIADRKGSDDILAFKINEEKVLRWLKQKCRRVAEELGKSKVNVGQNATSETFVSVETKEKDDDVLLAGAYGIVSDYISLELSQKLAKHLNITDDKVAAVADKRKSLQELEGAVTKKAKTDEKAKTADKKVTSKSKDFAKAASGSKNIMSFFKEA